MAAVMTYSSLVADMLTYTERKNDTDFIAQIPRLVMLAENRVATDLKTEGVQVVLSGTFGTGMPTIAKPAFWRDTISFQVTKVDGTKYNILPRYYEYCRQCYPNPATLGVPRFYADYNFDNFLIVPTPNAPLAFELISHVRLDPLDVTNQTNWMTVNAPQMLFYAAMTESMLYLKNDPSVWGGFYQDMLGGLTKEDSARSSDRTTVPS